MNGDGKPDLAVTNYNTNGLTLYPGTVSVLLGSGDGSPRGQRTDYATGAGPTPVAIGDLNGDGKPDLEVTNGGYLTILVLLGNGHGSF